MRRVLSRWWLAGALITSACDLNPRPEDPGALGKNNPSNLGHVGVGGNAATETPAPGAGGVFGGIDIGGTPTPVEAGATSRPVVTSDASASDAGTDAGTEAGPTARDDALP